MMLKARYVVPVDGPVIGGGAVVVEGETLAAVGRARDLRSTPLTDYGDAVILPGFVNAHTHLELTLLAGRVPPTPDFVDWLRRLVRMRDTQCRTEGAVHKAVRIGCLQSLRAGVTMVGDMTSTPLWTRPVLAESPLGGVSFGEVIAVGRGRHRLAERLDAAAETAWQNRRLRTGVAPHAPYTVEPAAIRACVDRARSIHAPLGFHLAETAAEERFTRSGDGPLRAYLSELGLWDASVPVGGCGPVELAETTGLLGARTVVAHANYVTDDGLHRLAKSGTSVAYCPRTHAAFGHPPHRFREMLAGGLNVCLGTDSLASNPSLSILDEMRFLRRRFPDLPPGEILAMGTIRGARALGGSDKNGSLTAGKKADLVVLPLEGSSPGITWDSILDSTAQPVAVYVSGTLEWPADF